MGFEPGLFHWPPLRLARFRCERGSVDVVCPPVLPFVADREEDQVRAVALDVHRDFCEVAVVADGRLRSAGRIRTRPEALELFAQSVDARAGSRWR
jgi:transposase